MTKKITPRSYQKTALKNGRKLLAQGKRVLVFAPGGSGKTVMIGLFTKTALREKARVLVVAHRKELLKQATDHLLVMGVPEKQVLRLNGKPVVDVGQLVVVTGVQRAMKLKTNFDYIMVDEAHRSAARTYLKLAKKHAKAKFVGFTATPARLDGKSLSMAFDELLNVVSMEKLIKKSLLSQPRYFTDVEELLPKLEGLLELGGDYEPGDLEKRVAKRKIVGGVVKSYLRRAKGLQAIVFAVTNLHSRMLAESFMKSGVRAAHVGSDLADGTRDEIIEKFRNGDLDVLCNCELLVEGFNVPNCRVVVMARPTKSYTKFQQQAARAMRPHSTRAILLDHARNIVLHGLPHVDRTFSLKHGHRNTSAKHLVKICSDVNCCALNELSAESCTECGKAFPSRNVAHLPEEVQKQLTELQARDISLKLGELKKSLQQYAVKKGLGGDWVRSALKQAESMLRKYGYN